MLQEMTLVGWEVIIYNIQIKLQIHLKFIQEEPLVEVDTLIGELLGILVNIPLCNPK